jgi:alcohol oxidase
MVSPTHLSTYTVFRISKLLVGLSLFTNNVVNSKVEDLSIAPGNVGANTGSTAMVIGEKAAVIIAKELGFDL